MTDAAPASGDAVRHVPDPAVVAAYAALRADAVAVLTGWDRAGRRPGPAAARATWPTWRRTPTPCEGRAAGAPHGILRRARPGRRPRAAHPAPQGRRLVPVRRAPRARRRLRCGRRPAARPARSPASTTSSRCPSPVQLDRHRLVGSLRRLPRAPRRAVRGGGAGRGAAPGQRGVARRAVVAGRRPARGHPRRARPAGVTRARRPRARLTRPSTGSTSPSASSGRPSAWASPSRKPRARSRRGYDASSAPERRSVPRHEQVGELVEQHVVEHVVGHVAQPVGDPDGALRGRARGPAPAHRRHPPHAGRAGVAAEVAARELLGARGEGLVGRTAGAARRPSSRASIRSTHWASSAALNEAGMSTTVRAPSR